MKIWLINLIVLATISPPARPDTITLRNNLSVNGDLLSMSAGILKFKARFRTTEKDASIQIEDVQNIEFNARKSNVGPPPKIFGFGPPSGDSTESTPSSPPDTIVLRGGVRQACTLVSIDAQRIHCTGKLIDFDRDKVLRIVVGSR